MNFLFLGLLYLSQVAFWMTALLVFSDQTFKYFMPKSDGPDPLIFGFGGLMYIILPFALSLLICSLSSTLIFIKVFNSEKYKFIILISYALAFLNYQFIEPYIKGTKRQSRQLSFLKNENKNSNHSSFLKNYKFESEYWFLDKIYSEAKLLSLLEKTFNEKNTLVLDYKFGLNIIPSKVFDKYLEPGKSLQDVLNGVFNIVLNFQNKEIILRTAKNPDEPSLTLVNSQYFANGQLGLNVKIKNTNKSIVFFLPVKVNYRNKKRLGETFIRFNSETLIFENDD